MARRGGPASSRALLALATALASILAMSLEATASGSPSQSAHQRARSGATQTVIVTLRDRAELGSLAGLHRPARLRTVVRALHAVARDAQAPLTRRLRAWSDSGQVSAYRRLWVVDAVSVTATPEVIARIAARRDVASVTADTVRLVPASTSPPAAHLVTDRAPEAWAAGDDGTGVVVATLDSGADVTSPDLESRWRGGANSWYDPYGQHPAAPVDLSGHGTATLGAIVGGDASGTAIGVAPGAQWIAARVFDDRGTSTATAVHLAFQWLLDPDHDPSTADAPQVVNASWSLGTGPSCDLTFQPDVQALSRAGILPVFAAGNFGPTPGSAASPANYPESLAVGALADPATPLGSSSRGPSTCGGRAGSFPDLAAPGKDVLTTDRYGLYQVASGTSMAAPQVAGVLALVLAAHPGLPVGRQREVLTGTAVDLGATGPDTATGFGRVDAMAAVAAAAVPDPDFALTASDAVTVAAGSSGSFPVSVSPADGFTGEVTLAVSAPSGLSATATPAAVSGGAGTSTVTVSAAPGTPPASYSLVVTGTSGSVQHSVTTVVTVTPPPVVLELSTSGNALPPGVSGSADDADALSWDGSRFQRTVDASATPYRLPTGANVDGFARLDAQRFYVSFAADVTVPGLGAVQDEDVLLWDGAQWRVWFDGTARGLTSSSLDLDAISVVDGRLYFSTYGVANPPGVRGTADDADVYVWDGSTFSRFWDASRYGVASAVNVDGLDVAGPGHVALSFSTATATLPGLGSVQDEDVVRWDDGVWHVVFDGTAAGLTRDALDVDAFDLP